jgi:hypothetical protein
MAGLFATSRATAQAPGGALGRRAGRCDQPGSHALAPWGLCTSCFPLPAICAIKGTKGAPVPRPSPARHREKWRVSHDL